ncbi:MAG: UDP-N-acetylmuramoyl-tripeptide--D-alanyl-D-alanine ligase [Candidatus Rokubacteria bacterium]|nr:UDP-N-acetylmuramoyl-tripeptide--D-alanyl-D-alanine ligase [Candidatus Rokubacteria bacterium]
MPHWTMADLLHATEGTLIGGDAARSATGVSIDSRTLRPGEVFFAIRGPRHDGHDYLAQAIERGAAAAVVSRRPERLAPPVGFPVVLVEDTTPALQRLATHHRRGRRLPVIAVTGSNGKTTTKELIAAVLGEERSVFKAPGNLNNHWGLPLALLGLEAHHEAAVLEMGMSGFGEIAALCRIAQPTVGVLTTIAPAHLETLGSVAGVQKAKGELVEAIGPDGVVVLNADDPLVAALGREARGRVVRYGRAEGAEVRLLGAVVASADGLEFSIGFGGVAQPVHLPLAGEHNAGNALAAAAVGLALGLAPAVIARGLAKVAPLKGRLQWRDAHGVRLLDDTYNANPGSVRAALDTLRAAGGPGRVFVVLGDMLELGTHTEAAHREAGRWVAGLPADGLLTLGPAARLAAAAAQAAGCPDARALESAETVAAALAERLAPGDRCLVKGSRGMRMERVIERLLPLLARRDG